MTLVPVLVPWVLLMNQEGPPPPNSIFSSVQGLWPRQHEEGTGRAGYRPWAWALGHHWEHTTAQYTHHAHEILLVDEASLEATGGAGQAPCGGQVHVCVQPVFPSELGVILGPPAHLSGERRWRLASAAGGRFPPKIQSRPPVCVCVCVCALTASGSARVRVLLLRMFCWLRRGILADCRSPTRFFGAAAMWRCSVLNGALPSPSSERQQT